MPTLGMMQEITRVVPPTLPPKASPHKVETAPGQHAFGEVLRGIGDETKRGEALIQRAIRAGGAGRDLSATDLIALQAGVYRYVEVVDLASKLVDRVSQAAKTVTQGGSGG